MKLIRNSLKMQTWNNFTARGKVSFASAVYATAYPSIRLFVRPSHSGIVSKQGNAEEFGLRLG